jgi:chromodomain-helicase-DNA-binding protein 7
LNSLAIDENIFGPLLIVASLSTLSHCQNEFENWTDLNAVVYHGNLKVIN